MEATIEYVSAKYSSSVLSVLVRERRIRSAGSHSVYIPHLKACTHSFYLSGTMHTAIVLAALASVAYSAPKPQVINLDAIALDFAPPELVKAPVNVEMDIPEPSTPDAITPLQNVTATKRDLVVKRDGDCKPYPAGSGPVPSPDTPSAFQSDPDFAVCLCRRI